MTAEEKFYNNVSKNKSAENIKILGKYQSLKSRIQVQCKIDGYSWDTRADYLFNEDIKCPVCFYRVALKGVNDLWTTHPEIAELLTDPNEGYTCTYKSIKKRSFTCKYCGTPKISTIPTIIRTGHLACHVCGDTVTIPNKIMACLLLNLGIDYDPEKRFSWGYNLENHQIRYDFYIPSKSTIIEMNGIQHYQPSHLYSNTYTRTLIEEQANDLFKKQLAFENGIQHYIIIDARKSEYNFIKNNILQSELSDIFDLSQADWHKIFLDASSPVIREIADYWNQGISLKEIKQKTKRGRKFIVNALKKAAILGFCDYSSDSGKERQKVTNSKKVVCLEDKIIYPSIRGASRILNIQNGCIRACCDSRHSMQVSLKGKHYFYLDNFLEMPQSEIIDILKKPVGTPLARSYFCVEENTIFFSIQKMCDWANVSRKKILDNVKGLIDHAGLHPVTGQPLHWREVQDEDIINYYDLNNIKENLKVYA